MDMLAAGWTPSELAGLAFKRKLVASAREEYSENKEFYHDMVRFNFCNGFKSNKEYLQVDFADAPPAEKSKFARIYSRLKGRSYRNIAVSVLGLPITDISVVSPVESKWAYTYYRKYKTWEYSHYKTVAEHEILTPLTTDEVQEYIKLF